MRNEFTYGDKVRRKTGGQVQIVRDIGPTVYNFADGTFALIEDQDCYELVEKASGFFRVATVVDGAPLADYLSHGYETRRDFRDALQKVVDWWGGRTGESVGSRHDLLLLRFHDTPGGRPDQGWIPVYLLEPVPVPSYMVREEDDETTREIDEIFGFVPCRR